MKIRCVFGVHKWDGCKCSLCGNTRNREHKWDGCKCKICGQTRNEGHDWNGCICKICGTIRDEGHSWNGCVCALCGKENHDWQMTSSSTKEYEDEAECGSYTINIFTCSKCGKEKTERINHLSQHHWELIASEVHSGLDDYDSSGRSRGDYTSYLYRCSKCGREKVEYSGDVY